MKLRIGSRGSQLALWQANHIAALAARAGTRGRDRDHQDHGDRLQEVTFAQVGSKGMFTKEIEEALAEGRVDLAVHSLKDLPTELPEPFALAATPPRVDPRDVFVSVKHAEPGGAAKGRAGGHEQPAAAGAVEGAAARILKRVEFRGNVDTRLRKLAEGQVEAILLAAAGLDRLGKTDWVRERLEPEGFLSGGRAGLAGD